MLIQKAITPCHRLRCRVPSNNSIIAISDVSIAVHHDGRIETAILTGGFRYAVSCNVAIHLLQCS